jgi:hypothetical protein
MMFLTVGCYTDYLDDPYYNVKSDTTYPIEMKNNAFVGGPTMMGDLLGCALTLPFTPIYFALLDDTQDDEVPTIL